MMRSAKLLSLATMLLVPVVASAQGQIRGSLRASSFFPLRPGNQWSYVVTPAVGEPSAFTVNATDPPGPTYIRRYVMLSGYFPGVPHEVSSEVFGTVVEHNRGIGRDYLWYILGAPVGTSWVIELAPSMSASPVAGDECIRGAKLTLAARDLHVTVPAGEFNRVVRVDWSTTCADAGILSEWFAPGVGLIRREESSFSGTVVTELAAAELGDIALPRMPLVTSLLLDRAVYVHNLMPPVDPSAFAAVSGTLTVHNGAGIPIDLLFTGCRSATIEVRDENGVVVLATKASAGGCCECDVVERATLIRLGIAIPFRFRLATAAGEPLRDGRYSVTATLDTSDPPPLRFAARARIEVQSVH